MTVPIPAVCIYLPNRTGTPVKEREGVLRRRRTKKKKKLPYIDSRSMCGDEVSGRVLYLGI